MTNVDDADGIIAILDEDWQPKRHIQTHATEIETMLLRAPTALGRAVALAAWKKLWQLQHHDSRRGGDRKSKSFKKAQGQSPKFWTLVADRLRLARSTILADIALAEEIGRADIARLWDSPICNDGGALKSFAALAPNLRDKVCAAFAAGRPWDRLLRDEKLKPGRDSDDAAFDRLVDAWADASKAVRRRFRDHIGEAA